METKKEFFSSAYKIRKQEDIDRLYTDWAETYDDELRVMGYRSPIRCASALAKFVPLETPVLDFGCGTGLSGEALKNVGLSSKKDSFPSHLSGGEQQRVAIARAMVNAPPIILADEPTGNLDQEISLEILKLFEELNHNGVTIIFATHSQDILKLGNHRVIVLNRGKVVSS